jgi:hypothetical protein
VIAKRPTRYRVVVLTSSNGGQRHCGVSRQTQRGCPAGDPAGDPAATVFRASGAVVCAYLRNDSRHVIFTIILLLTKESKKNEY